MAVQQSVYAVYDLSGDLQFVGHTQDQIAVSLGVNPATVWRTIKEGRRMIAGQIVIKHDSERAIKQSIELEKIAPKFKDIDGRYKRKYLAYDRQGNLAIKPLFLSEMITKLGAHKDTILDAVTKNHLANGHIIRAVNSVSYLPKRLSPHAKEFKVFQYDRKGKLVSWFTNMSTASRMTGIKYTDITNCVLKHVSTDANYYFTDHIPLVGFKTIRVKFKPKNSPVQIYISQSGSRVKMSISKACPYIGTSYITLKKKINAEDRFLFKGFLIELVQDSSQQN